MLRSLRQHADKRSPEREADALLVHGLPLLLQRAHRNRHRTLPRPASQVGDRHLPRTDEPQEH